MSAARCLVCSETEARPRFRGVRSIAECRGCCLVFAEPVGEDWLCARYSREYFQGVAYTDYLADRAAIHRNSDRALRELAALTPGRRLFDVGCAAGFFLEAARGKGWQVEGFELSEYASSYARDALQTGRAHLSGTDTST